MYCLRARECVWKGPPDNLDCEDGDMGSPGGGFDGNHGEKCPPGMVDTSILPVYLQ